MPHPIHPPFDGVLKIGENLGFVKKNVDIELDTKAWPACDRKDLFEAIVSGLELALGGIRWSGGDGHLLHEEESCTRYSPRIENRGKQET